MTEDDAALAALGLSILGVLLLFFGLYFDTVRSKSANIFPRVGAVVTIFALIFNILLEQQKSESAEIDLTNMKLQFVNLQLLQTAANRSLLELQSNLDNDARNAEVDNILNINADILRLNFPDDGYSIDKYLNDVETRNIWINWMSIFYAIVGTLVWGFGDLLVLKLRKSKNAL